MRLFVGLGNPGNRYKQNRHNVGFMFMEFLKNQMASDADWRDVKSSQARLCETSSGDQKLLIVEPQTFMNASGEAVSKIARFYKIVPADIFVAHDDLDIPLGKTKVQLGTGPKLHNGLSSIEAKLGTDQFYRIRIGVENRAPDNHVNGEVYVLQNFSLQEKEVVTSVFQKLYQQLAIQHILP